MRSRALREEGVHACAWHCACQAQLRSIDGPQRRQPSHRPQIKKNSGIRKVIRSWTLVTAATASRSRRRLSDSAFLLRLRRPSAFAHMHHKGALQEAGAGAQGGGGLSS